MTNKDADYRISNQPCLECGSSDAMSIYGHSDEKGNEWEDSYCFSCNSYFSKEQLSESTVVVNREQKEKVSKKQPLTKEEVVALIKEVGYTSNRYRGIKDEYSRFYGHLTKLDANGKVVARYYPTTKDGKVVGYKSRFHPKLFGRDNRGVTGIECDLAGQVKFKSGSSKYCLVVGGEEDMSAAFQMLRDSQIERKQDEFEPIAVVSPTCGEGSAAKQIAAQYDWFNGFEIIVVGMDDDEAGRAATQKIIEVLPKDKVKVATWSGKDPNKMLQDGKQKQFVRDFYAAKDVIKDCVISSIDADDMMEEELVREKIPLPDFMYQLQEEIFCGGIPLGYIVNFIAGTGVGKSTITNEMIRKWIYDSPHKVGILSLELTAGQYMIAMTSREVGYKINLIKSPKEAIDFINQPNVIAARNKLKTNEYGEERFALIDEREGKLDHVKSQIIKLIKKHGCKLIVIDPIQDLFEGVSMDEQNGFVKWMKSVVKDGVTFANVCHIRKSSSSTDKEGKRVIRKLTEDDVHGVSSIVKSAGANVLMNRDKYAEDVVERNTTEVECPKCRWTGITGPAGKWYYSLQEHTMYDYNTYFKDKPVSADSELISNTEIEEESIMFDEYEGVNFEQ